MAVNSGDFVQAAGLLNNLVEQANGDLEHLDMSLYISVGKNYDRESGGGAVTLQSKSITKTPTKQQQQETVYPSPGFDGLSSVGVTVEAIPSEYVIPSGSVPITQNGTFDVSGKAQVVVSVPTGGDEPLLEQKDVTITPTEQQQQETVYPSPGFDGLSSVEVTVKAIPSEYVIPSGSVPITQNGTFDVSGKAQAIVNVPTGGGGAHYATGTYIPDATYNSIGNRQICTVADVGFTPRLFVLYVTNIEDVSGINSAVLFSMAFPSWPIKMTARYTNTSNAASAGMSISSWETQTNNHLVLADGVIYYRTAPSYSLRGGVEYTWEAYA